MLPPADGREPVLVNQCYLLANVLHMVTNSQLTLRYRVVVMIKGDIMNTALSLLDGGEDKYRNTLWWGLVV